MTTRLFRGRGGKETRMSSVWTTTGIWRMMLSMTVIMLIGATGCGKQETSSAQTKKNQDKVKIGAILPLTGSSASAGEYARKGILLAAKLSNEQRQSGQPEIEVVLGDSKNSAKDGLTVFNEQSSLGGIHFFIACNSGVVVPLAETIGTRNDILLMTTFSSAPGIPQRGPNILRLFVTAENEAGTMSRHLASRGIKHAAVFYINDDFGLGGMKRFREVFSKAGGTIAWSESWEKSGLDLRSRLQSMPTDIPALYIIGYEAGLGLSVKQARENGYKGLICTTVGMSLPAWRAAAGDAAEGVHYTNTGFTPDSDRTATREFVAAFKVLYNETPNSFSAFAFDAMTAVSRALRDCAGDGIKITPSEISVRLVATAPFEGAVGAIDFGPDREAAPPLTVWTIKNGKEVSVE